VDTKARGDIAAQVPQDRRSEILQYLKLFGYKPEKTILQVHIAGFFNKKGARPSPSARRADAASRRYGGTTFVIVGRSHDPSIMDVLIKPRKKPGDASPGYVGYLWQNKDRDRKAPHELLPLDFTPTRVPYPQDWKDLFATKGFMIAMHVPSEFAPEKNRLNRALYSAGKNANAKDSWNFIADVQKYGYDELVSRRHETDPDSERIKQTRHAVA
jgi:hypothetical protein